MVFEFSKRFSDEIMGKKHFLERRLFNFFPRRFYWLTG
jgi:hypothetical protein